MKYSRSFFVVVLLMAATVMLKAQSKTTEALHKKHKDALSLFFYNNTLRMINQKEDKEFDELIKDIEKMKFLMIRKDIAGFKYKDLISDYKSESFEEIMTSRHEGKNFDVFIREKNNTTKAMLVLINDDTNLYVLDILGSIALNKVTELFSTLDESTDIGKKIKAFANDKDEKKTNDKKQ